jgi:penicillin-binding protein 1A
MFLTADRTLWRKFEELILSLWLELRLSKPDILELYLNRVYFGAGAYGVESASRRFFNKGAQDVTMGEAAVLAGLLKAPSKYSPAWNPGRARARAEEVLAAMVESGFATPIDGVLNSIAEVRFAAPKVMRGETGVEYAVDAVLDRLPSLITADDSEIIIETTIDASLQRRAQQLVQDAITAEGSTQDASQAALVVLDTDGGISVIVGGRSYGDSRSIAPSERRDNLGPPTSRSYISSRSRMASRRTVSCLTPRSRPKAGTRRTTTASIVAISPCAKRWRSRSTQWPSV